jgi:long-chain acyl-CoA synthetase
MLGCKGGGMNEQFFQERYPENYPGTIDADKYHSVIE